MPLLYDASNASLANITSYGARTDSPDNLSSIQSAISTGLPVYVPPGVFSVGSGTLTLISGQTLFGDGPSSVLQVPSGTFNVPLIKMGANSRISHLVLRESGAVPWGPKTSASNSIGILVSGANCLLDDMDVVGWTFPVSIRGDFASLRRIQTSFGGAWGVEVDSAQNVSLHNCVSHNNGLDGFKVQNEFSRLALNFTMDGCIAHSNGRRDLAGGGSETTNGNGLDLYHGGYRFKISNSRFFANWGSSVNLKGGGSDPLQGEGGFSNCEFTGALTTSNGGATHGVEIATNYQNGNNQLSFSNCLIADNQGDGAAVYAGSHIRFSNCAFIDNGGMGLRLPRTHDVSVADCSFVRNRRYGIIIGLSNDGVYESKRINITNSTFAGTYDPFLGDSGDPRSKLISLYAFTANSGTNVLTSSGHPFVEDDIVSVITYSGTLPAGLSNSVTYKAINVSGSTLQLASNFYSESPIDITSSGTPVFYLTKDGHHALRTYTDSADVTIDKCNFYNFTTIDGTFLSYAKNSRLHNSTFFGSNRVATYLLGGALDIDRCSYENTHWIGGVSYGSVRFNVGSGRLTNCTFSQPTLETNSRIAQIDVGALNVFAKNNKGYNLDRGLVVSSGASFSPEGFPFNVLDFGAVPDNATDSTVAIQHAINVASYLSPSGSQAGRPSVYIPAGRYLTTDTLNVPDRIAVYGDGIDSTVLRFVPTAGSKAAVQFSDTVPYHWFGSLRDLTITVPSGQANLAGIFLGQATRTKISNVYVNMDGVTGLDYVGLHVSGKEQIYVDNCSFLSPVGIRLAGTLDNCTFNNITYLSDSQGSGNPSTFPYAAVFIEPTCDVQRLYFGGRQTCVKKRHFLYYSNNAGSTSQGLTIENVRTESGPDPTQYEIFCSGANTVDQLVLRDCRFQSTQNGIWVGNVNNLMVNSTHFEVGQTILKHRGTGSFIFDRGCFYNGGEADLGGSYKGLNLLNFKDSQGWVPQLFSGTTQPALSKNFTRYKTSNAVPTTISGVNTVNGPLDGQIFTFISDANTTFSESATLQLANSLSFSGAGILVLFNDSGVLKEISRASL